MAVLPRLTTSFNIRTTHLISPLPRFYGVAPAIQPSFDHDYDHFSDFHGDTNVLSAIFMPDSYGSVPPERGVQWVFIGNQSSKKHVYAYKLSKLMEVPYISISSLVRQDLDPSSCIYKQIASSVNEGKLVPENILLGLLSKRLDDGYYYKGETGFILDGIPRTHLQAEIIDELADIDLVVNFKTPKDCLQKDLGNSVLPHPPDMSLQCKQTDAPMDNSGTSNKRLQSYANQSKPVEDYYRNQKKLIDFHVAERPTTETWRGLLAVLRL